MEERTPEQKANSRMTLVLSARNAKEDCFSMLEWMEHEDVLNYCKEKEIDPSVLEHIAHWVWQPMSRK